MSGKSNRLGVKQLRLRRYEVMHSLLNLAFLTVFLFAWPRMLFARLFEGKYRDGLIARFFGWTAPRSNSRPCMWLHAASLGEVNVLAALLPELRRIYPDWEVVVSTSTNSGYEHALHKFPQARVFSCPFDLTWATATAVARVRPRLFVVVEFERLHNLFRSVSQSGAQLVLVNGRLSEHNDRFCRIFPAWSRRLMSFFDLVLVQHVDDARRFQRLGVANHKLQVTGSIKFDGALPQRDNPLTRQLRQLANLTEDDVVLLAGSTQGQEERLVLAAFSALAPEFPRLKLLLCPRHASRFQEVSALLNRRSIAWQARSTLEANRPNPSARVLLIDSIGELHGWWGTAHLAFVGGSLGSARGGQNMIEPAAYGAAVAFGPNTQNFRDVVSLLLASDAAVMVEDQRELTAFLRRSLEQPELAAEMGQRARELVSCQGGAVASTLQSMRSGLEPLAPSIYNPKPAPVRQQFALSGMEQTCYWNGEAAAKS